MNRKLAMLLFSIVALTGCQTPTPTPVISVAGLWPEQPPLRFKPMNFWTGGNFYVWPRVESQQPTLRWEQFPRAVDLTSDTNHWTQGVTDVTYDLQIWQSVDDFPAELIYERAALPDNLHQVERPLPPHTIFFWTTRARFRWHGQTRVTEWSHIVAPTPFLIGVPSKISNPDARYFRFRTP